MKTIVTKFLGATDTKGARIKCTSWLGSTTHDYYSVLGKDNMDTHESAANMHIVNKIYSELAKQGSDWHQFNIVSGGMLPDETGYVFLIKEMR